MACLKLGQPGRFFYRVRVHRRRKGDRASMSEADYAALVTAAHRALNAPVVLVWDNLNTHRSQKMRQFTEANSDWLTVVRLPGYAPDLNAVEGAWSVMKSGLGNHAATTLDELEAMVRSRLRSIQRRPGLINALLGQTGLSLEPTAALANRPWPFNPCSAYLADAVVASMAWRPARRSRAASAGRGRRGIGSR